MSKTNNIIEINGKKYDAVTGEAINNGQVKADSKIIKPEKVNKKPSASADDTPNKKLSNKAKSKLNNVQHHQPQHSKTLMRHSIKKPSLSAKRNIKSQSPIKTVGKTSAAEISPKLTVNEVDPSRLHHAKSIPKSKLVSKFSNGAKTTEKYSFDSPINPTEVTNNAPAPTSSITPKRDSTDLLEKAIHNANSHHQTKHRASKSNKTRKIFSISSVAFMALFFIGIAGYLNMSNLKLRMASSGAGFAASLPSYHPAGYSVSSVDSNPGEVATIFKSNTDASRQYKLIEKSTAWTNEELVANFVAQKDPNYQTLNVKGQTVYLYNQSNVTWVNNGIWYLVSTNGVLSNQQIQNLAASL